MEHTEGNRPHRSTKTRLKKIITAIMGTTALFPKVHSQFPKSSTGGELGLKN